MIEVWQNRLREVTWRPTVPAVRKLGLLMLAGFPATAFTWGGIVWLASGQWRWEVVGTIAFIGIVLSLWALLMPGTARFLYGTWHTLAAILEMTLSTIVLGLFYLVILTPAGIIQRILGRRRFQMNPRPEASTYWQPAPPRRPRRHYYRQY